MGISKRINDYHRSSYNVNGKLFDAKLTCLRTRYSRYDVIIIIINIEVSVPINATAPRAEHVALDLHS